MSFGVRQKVAFEHFRNSLNMEYLCLWLCTLRVHLVSRWEIERNVRGTVILKPTRETLIWPCPATSAQLQVNANMPGQNP